MMLSLNAASWAPQRASTSADASPIPARLMKARKPFGSCSSIKKSRTTTTSAVNSTCTAGKSGMRLTFIVVRLSARLVVVAHRRRNHRRDSFQVQFDRRLDTLEKRLRINAHQHDQK